MDWPHGAVLYLHPVSNWNRDQQGEKGECRVGWMGGDRNKGKVDIIVGNGIETNGTPRVKHQTNSRARELEGA